MTAETLATHFGITAMAVRQHPYALQEEQLITYQEEPSPDGTTSQAVAIDPGERSPHRRCWSLLGRHESVIISVSHSSNGSSKN